MHIEAAQDDDGKEYTIVTNKSGEGPWDKEKIFAPW